MLHQFGMRWVNALQTCDYAYSILLVSMLIPCNLLLRCVGRSVSKCGTYRYSSTLQLRDYQQHVIDKCIDRIDNGGKRRIGVSLATGGGKTVIFTNLIKQLSEKRNLTRTLILAHRRELVMQAAGTIKKFMPMSNIQIEMGKYFADIDIEKTGSVIIIASVQSLIRRLDKYTSDDFDLIIIDEAHHAVASSYLRIINHFDDKIPLVGFSATFERADNKALSTVLDEIIYHRGILEMISDKWLCEGKFTTVRVNYDLSKVDVSTNTNDFKLDKLSSVMNTPQVNEIVLKTYLHKSKEYDGFKSTLLFAVDILHVESLHSIFVSHGINAKYVTSNTKTDQRDQIISDFKSGKIDVLINCGIFTEGTDMPNIDCILLCRPTKSRSLLIQMIGRGLRLHHSKTHCHIIDFIGASNVGVVSIPTLAGIENFDGTLENATLDDLQVIKDDFVFRKEEKLQKENLAKESYNNWIKDMNSFDLTLSTFDSFESYYQAQELKSGNATSETSLFSDSKYPWIKFSNTAWALSLQNGHHLRVYKESSKEKNGKIKYALKLYREIPHYLRAATGTKFVTREVITDESILKIIGKVEEVMNNLTTPSGDGTKVKNFTKFAKWRYEAPTPRQKSAIKTKLEAKLKDKDSPYSLGMEDITNYINQMTKGEASNILFATSLAPVYPIKSLLRVLNYKKNM